jgi:hypothetical protein
MREHLRCEIAKHDRALTAPWEDRVFYAEYLAQTYYYVGHSTRLLACAATRLGVDREKLHHRFLKHAAEERSHHLLASRDLSKLGFSLEDFPELPATSALYESQYYRIEHIGPTMLLGYILALEGNAVAYAPGVYQRVRSEHGDSTVSFLRVHAEEDPDHLEKAFASVEALPTGEQERIATNARFSLGMYEMLLNGIVDSARRRDGRQSTLSTPTSGAQRAAS